MLHNAPQCSAVLRSAEPEVWSLRMPRKQSAGAPERVAPLFQSQRWCALRGRRLDDTVAKGLLND